MLTPEPESNSNEFIICQALFVQLYQSSMLLLAQTDTNGHEIAGETVAPMKPIFNQFLLHTQKNLSISYEEFTKRNIPAGQFKVMLIDYHCFVLIPLIQMCYSTDTWSIFGEDNQSLFNIYRCLIDATDSVETNQEVCWDTFKIVFQQYSEFSSKMIDYVAGVDFVDLQPFGNCKDVMVEATDHESELKILFLISEFLFQQAISVINYYDVIDENERAILVTKFKAYNGALTKEKIDDDVDNGVDDSVSTLAGLIVAYSTNFLKYVENGTPFEKLL
ncbi:hypothetical protein H4219_004730 [Mycoemilia scoparia]|uniref:Uncharacterized protein n=1 Tax=Mycoemilia scoparia TaxID=417184 RepID=A0A9W7ZVC8_9FUNG|nr:hypothetical protein H4219_004730 [Mycoemilia scoparia]